MRTDVRPRGVLDEEEARGVYHAHRVLPGDALRAHVAYFWVVRWALEVPYVQQVLTHPAAHFVFEQDDVRGRCASRLVGPKRLRFTRTLEGAGHVLGVALQPGTARAWLGYDVARLTDSVAPVRWCSARQVRELLASQRDEDAVELATQLVLPQLPALDAEALLAHELVARIMGDREVLTVERLTALSHRSERALQRLFRRHVGVSPKQVIRRFRLAEAAQTLSTMRRGSRESLTGLAHRLGYFDQAHFTRDFRAVVGRLPSDYLRARSR